MCAAQGEPLGPIRKPETKGPELVQTQQSIPQVSVQTTERGQSHPVIAILITGVIALASAVVLAGSVLSWLVLRSTGVNWMFEGG
jgi:hypothetical protein